MAFPIDFVHRGYNTVIPITADIIQKYAYRYNHMMLVFILLYYVLSCDWYAYIDKWSGIWLDDEKHLLDRRIVQSDRSQAVGRQGSRMESDRWQRPDFASRHRC